MKDDVTIRTIQPLVEENLRNDTFLQPVAFVCNKDGAGILDLNEGMKDDQAKNELALWLRKIVLEYKAHKIIIATEAWTYEAPKGMSLEEVKELVHTGEYKDKFVTKETYQITEITYDNVKGLSREFTRDETDGHIEFKEEVYSEDAETERYLPVQKALVQLQ